MGPLAQKVLDVWVVVSEVAWAVVWAVAWGKELEEMSQVALAKP